MFRPLKNWIDWVPMGEGGDLGFGSAKFRGVNWLDIRPTASSQNVLVDSADVFSKNDLELGKCNVLKHNIKITEPQPFKERYRRIPPHLYEEVKLTSKRRWRLVQLGGVSVHGPVLWCW